MLDRISVEIPRNHFTVVTSLHYNCYGLLLMGLARGSDLRVTYEGATASQRRLWSEREIAQCSRI